MDRKILIIEDYPPTVDMIIAYLENHYAYDYALTGPEGLEKAFSFKPDLILLDIMLPGMSGLEVCRKLRADPRTAKTPIVIESVKNEPDDIQLGMAAGANAHLTKPFDAGQLMNTIKMLLG